MAFEVIYLECSPEVDDFLPPHELRFAYGRLENDLQRPLATTPERACCYLVGVTPGLGLCAHV